MIEMMSGVIMAGARIKSFQTGVSQPLGSNDESPIYFSTPIDASKTLVFVESVAARASNTAGGPVNVYDDRFTVVGGSSSYTQLIKYTAVEFEGVVGVYRGASLISKSAVPAEASYLLPVGTIAENCASFLTPNYYSSGAYIGYSLGVSTVEYNASGRAVVRIRRQADPNFNSYFYWQVIEFAG